MDDGYLLVIGILIICGPIWLLAYYRYLDNKKMIKDSDEGSISFKDLTEKEKALQVIKIVLAIFIFIFALAIEFDYIELSGPYWGVAFVVLLWVLAYDGYQRHKK